MKVAICGLFYCKQFANYCCTIEHTPDLGAIFLNMIKRIIRMYSKLQTKFYSYRYPVKKVHILFKLSCIEMRVDYPGINGCDRTSILLPSVQTELMKTLKSTGKPVVFVMMTASSIATPWESENIPAFVNAWYGGKSAGPMH
jgi:hypothetical protein